MQFFGMTHEEMYGLLFGSQIKCPDTTEVKEICPRGNNKVIIYFLISL